MGRTLYISQANKPVIKRDGPSIWVKEEGRAGRRIPARLVGRVIVIGNVRLDSGTITLFADNNIPITFMNRRADESAVVIPYNHRLPDHYKEQKVLLDSEGTILHYQKWATAKRILLQLNMLRRYVPPLAAKLEIKGFGEGNYQEILKGIRKVKERKWLAVNGIITGIFRNVIIESLIHSGLDPHLGVIHRRHNFGLALDICYIMGGESDMQTLQFFHSVNLRELIKNETGHWVMTDRGIRNIAHRFENKRKEVKEKAEDIIDELFDLIREMLS
ncbi:MAG TPA: hypothetical protein ENG83_10840 [Nitrospirae bacterium]|nr:CRISPR-associated endonuclease Cas1 [bacterium BMS3Abin06]HDH12668.1 hypothetical protein [Nitrospirota bacterium]HDY99976.1 hypothetical protein [Nitrospirota bacterium]